MGHFTDVEEFVHGQEKSAAPAGMSSGLWGTVKKTVTGPGALIEAVGKMLGSEKADGGIANAVAGIGKYVKENPGKSLAVGGAIGAVAAAHPVYKMVQNMQRAKKQDETYNFVKRTDPILREADRTELASAYDTFRAFAPTLATDPNATRSFLREAVTSGGGVNYNTINLIARTESAIHGGDPRDN